ncbi:MAG: hypothetical protein J1G01_00640 [Clostridiales bacterium]|nr:hypothetical protein [Clostridiales bacterium]
MENIVIAIGCTECGQTPVMPYVGGRFDGKDFSSLAKYYLGSALLRCGFDVVNVSKTTCEPQDIVMVSNRYGIDAAVIVSYTAFGSRKSFNGVHGSVVRYSQGRFMTKSRVMCEDICAKLSLYRDCTTSPDGTLGSAICQTAIVDVGYSTCFEEAKLIHDPDFAVQTAEHIAMGICENLGMPYVRRDDIMSYPMLCSAATGKRGKKIKMLQTLLCANGYDVDIDGIYGKATDTAVKTFCINNDMIGCDGVTSAVWRDLLLLNPKHLEYRSRDNAVRYIQRKLLCKLYKCPQSGELDDETLAAISQFLAENGSELTVSKEYGVSADVIKFISPIGGGRPRLF